MKPIKVNLCIRTNNKNIQIQFYLLFSTRSYGLLLLILQMKLLLFKNLIDLNVLFF